MIAVDEGLVTRLTPHSGHYRTDRPYFESFIDGLGEQGLDLHKVWISREEALLWGMTHWGRLRKAKRGWVQTKKDAIHDGLDTVKSSFRPEAKQEVKERKLETEKAPSQEPAS